MQNSWVLKDIIDDENSEEMEFPEELRFNKRSYERYYDTSSADEFVEFIQLLPPRQIPLSGQFYSCCQFLKQSTNADFRPKCVDLFKLHGYFGSALR
jgi:hypothetical protein